MILCLSMSGIFLLNYAINESPIILLVCSVISLAVVTLGLHAFQFNIYSLFMLIGLIKLFQLILTGIIYEKRNIS